MLCNSGHILAFENLKNQIRLDGRGGLDHRDIKITFPGLIGQSLVSFGSTVVLCTVNGEVVSPFDSRPNEGFYHFHVEIGALTTIGFEPGKSTEQEMFICSTIEHMLRDSGTIETESLCIISGKYVWSIIVDMLVLEDAGNALDACALSAIASTMHFKKQQVKIDGEKVELLSPDHFIPGELLIHHIPIFVTFAIVEDFIMVDPSALEEELADSVISVAVNQFEQICKIQKIGGKEITFEQLDKVLQYSKQQFKHVYNSLKKSMELDKEARLWVLTNIK